MSELERNVRQCAERNHGFWWVDLHSHGWYYDPDLWALMDKVRPYAMERLVSDEPFSPRVAAIVSEESMIHRRLAASDCLVLPSYREGFPNSVIEAGAMELPCVVTNINGANEIIAEKENGLIVPARDADALYSAMKLIAEDRELYNNLRTRAREMVASRYERGFVWSCLKDFYRETLKDV